jgi:hypothetical protein
MALMHILCPLDDMKDLRKSNFRTPKPITAELTKLIVITKNSQSFIAMPVGEKDSATPLWQSGSVSLCLVDANVAFWLSGRNSDFIPLIVQPIALKFRLLSTFHYNLGIIKITDHHRDETAILEILFTDMQSIIYSSSALKKADTSTTLEQTPRVSDY